MIYNLKDLYLLEHILITLNVAKLETFPKIHFYNTSSPTNTIYQLHLILQHEIPVFAMDNKT